MDLGLKDRVVIVTGAASGIGKAIAEAYAAEGAKLALADINLPGLEKLKKALKKAEVYVEQVDITDAKACKKLSSRCFKRRKFEASRRFCNQNLWQN